MLGIFDGHTFLRKTFSHDSQFGILKSETFLRLNNFGTKANSSEVNCATVVGRFSTFLRLNGRFIDTPPDLNSFAVSY